MKMVTAALVWAALLLPWMAWAQSSLSFTFHAGATATGNGNVMQADSFSTIHVQIEGTFVGRVMFEGKTKDATNYAVVRCSNRSDGAKGTESDLPGYWDCPGGAYNFRVRVWDYTSGTIVVTGTGTTAVSGGGIGGSTPGLSDVGAIDRTYGEATSQATGIRIGSAGADVYLNVHYNATTGLQVTCEVAGVLDDCDKANKVLSGKRYKVTNASNEALLNFEPNASNPIDQYALGTKKVRSYVFISAASFTGDGANCPGAASTVTLNSGPRVSSMTCGSSSNGDMDVDFVMPPEWDGAAVKFEPVYLQTAANTSAMHSDVKAQCRGVTEVPSSTWGTSVPIDDAAVTGSGAEDRTLSADVTPAGTCAGGDHLFVRYTLDVTGTTTPEATLHFLGLGMYWFKKSMSS